CARGPTATRSASRSWPTATCRRASASWPSPDDVEAAYLEDAMDQHLAGRPVEVQRTAALGCTLRLAGGR
ncbi:MAG TPA: hypothetical protein VK610_01340, partial [Rhodothermales bacterium]|nr:hypothetical protein [Rhodothermales bacterium]